MHSISHSNSPSIGIQALQFLHKARETIVDKTLWCVDKLYVDLPISHVVSVLNSVNSFIHFGSAVTIKKITQAADKIRPVSQSFTHAGYVLSGASTFLDITGLLSGEVGCEDGKEKGINFLKVASTILLIAADLLGHVKVAGEIGLFHAEKLIKWSIAGFGLGQIQLGFGIMGSILDVINTVRKIWVDKKIYLSELFLLTASVVVLAGTIIDCAPLPAAKIAALALILIGSSLLVVRHYIESYKWNKLLYSASKV